MKWKNKSIKVEWKWNWNIFEKLYQKTNNLLGRRSCLFGWHSNFPSSPTPLSIFSELNFAVIKLLHFFSHIFLLLLLLPVFPKPSTFHTANSAAISRDFSSHTKVNKVPEKLLAKWTENRLLLRKTRRLFVFLQYLWFLRVICLNTELFFSSQKMN